MYKKLNSILTKHDKKILIFLVLYSIFIALVETIGVTAIMPFIMIASDFTAIHSNKYYQVIYTLLNMDTEIQFVLLFGIVLIIFYIFRGMVNLFYSYLLAKFSHERYYLITYRLFENYLGMPYHKFVESNSSVLTKSIINEAQNLTTMISSMLTILSEVFIAICIYSIMLYVDYKATLLITLLLIANAIFLIKTVSKQIKVEGMKREGFQKKFYAIISSTFGNFKIIKLQSNDREIMQDFQSISSGFTKSNIRTETLYHVPRLFIETLAFVLVSSLIVYLVYKYHSNISHFMSILSMFILALYRLMPSANRIMSGYNIIQHNHSALDIIHNDLMYDNEVLGNEPVNFNTDITIQGLKFGYDEQKNILENINFTINKNDKVAFIGPSGSGKSTLVDIIIGLYKPNEGKILVDNKSLTTDNIKQWRSKIGYIPQQVYLFDGTVAENICFGHTYDEVKIKEALEQAKILTFLEMHQQGIHTKVGEGGIKLSGGQKQRIAIARALYQDPEILVLDEATSALDEAIEKELMNEIYNICKDKTLIIIAHRLSTIDRCEKVYKIENKNIVQVDNL